MGPAPRDSHLGPAPRNLICGIPSVDLPGLPSGPPPGGLSRRHTLRGPFPGGHFRGAFYTGVPLANPSRGPLPGYPL
jgi:hypothetical protein